MGFTLDLLKFLLQILKLHCSLGNMIDHYDSLQVTSIFQFLLFLNMYCEKVFPCMSCNRYTESEKRFNHVLEACGVYKSLMKLGVKEGDTVMVGEVCISLSTSSVSLILNQKENGSNN